MRLLRSCLTKDVEKVFVAPGNEDDSDSLNW